MLFQDSYNTTRTQKSTRSTRSGWLSKNINLALKSVIPVSLCILSACGSDTPTVQFSGLERNIPPVADAGEQQVVQTGSIVRLSGKAQDDDGRVTSYRWTQIDGPIVAIQAPTTPYASFVLDDDFSEAKLTFKFTVVDNGGARASDIVNIRVFVPEEFVTTAQYEAQ